MLKTCAPIFYFLLQAVKCSELIGFYVSPEVWCSLVLPAVRTSAGCRLSGTSMASPVAVGPVQCTSCLTVLAALVRGAKKEQIQPHLQVQWERVEQLRWDDCRGFVWSLGEGEGESVRSLFSGLHHN